MQFLEQEISEITETTWQAMLGLDIHPHSGEAVLQPTQGFLTGRVEISGAWNGVVLLHGSSQLAESAASMIFANGAPGVTEQDKLDAMYELTNIIGGNIKSLLPESSHLSLPSVEFTAPDRLTVSGATHMSELVFDCQGQPLFVNVWKYADKS